MREATRLAAQLQQCRLPPLAPGPQGGGGSPRSPRRETFVVKDSPVRALLPTVPPARQVGGGAAGGGGTRAGSWGARGAGCTPPPSRSPPSLCFQDTPGCHPPPAPKGPPPGGRGTLGRGGPPRLCPPRGAGAAARGKSEPLRKGTAGNGVTGLGGGRGQLGYGQLLGTGTRPWGIVPWGPPHHGDPRAVGTPAPWVIISWGHPRHGDTPPLGSPILWGQGAGTPSPPRTPAHPKGLGAQWGPPPQPCRLSQASQRRGVAVLPPPRPVHPAPEPPPLPSLSPAAAPPRPAPSPSPPAGLGRWGRRRAGGDPRGPAWRHREVRLGAAPPGTRGPPRDTGTAPLGPRWRGAAPCLSFPTPALPPGAGAAPGGAGSGCRAAPPSSRLRPPRKTTASSTPR